MDAIVAVYADWGIGAKGTQPLVIPHLPGYIRQQVYFLAASKTSYQIHVDLLKII